MFRSIVIQYMCSIQPVDNVKYYRKGEGGVEICGYWILFAMEFMTTRFPFLLCYVLIRSVMKFRLVYNIQTQSHPFVVYHSRLPADSNL